MMLAPASGPHLPPYLLLALLLGLTGKHCLGVQSPLPDPTTSPMSLDIKGFQVTRGVLPRAATEDQGLGVI